MNRPPSRRSSCHVTRHSHHDPLVTLSLTQSVSVHTFATGTRSPGAHPAEPKTVTNSDTEYTDSGRCDHSAFECAGTGTGAPHSRGALRRSSAPHARSHGRLAPASTRPVARPNPLAHCHLVLACPAPPIAPSDDPHLIDVEPAATRPSRGRRCRLRERARPPLD